MARNRRPPNPTTLNIGGAQGRTPDALVHARRHKRLEHRWKRYEKPQPGHQLQVDVKFVAALGKTRRKQYQFTAIDDCTRLRVLRIYDRLNQKTAIQFIDLVLQKLPFRVERIQTDNGSEFQSAFHWHVLDRGIEHVYIKPATPRLNGKVERSHCIDAEEFYGLLGGVVLDETGLFKSKLQEWEDFNNFDRPHGALGGQTPYERLREKMRASDVSGQRQSHTGDAVALGPMTSSLNGIGSPEAAFAT